MLNPYVGRHLETSLVWTGLGFGQVLGIIGLDLFLSLGVDILPFQVLGSEGDFGRHEKK